MRSTSTASDAPSHPPLPPVQTSACGRVPARFPTPFLHLHPHSQGPPSLPQSLPRPRRRLLPFLTWVRTRTNRTPSSVLQRDSHPDRTRTSTRSNPVESRRRRTNRTPPPAEDGAYFHWCSSAGSVRFVGASDPNMRPGVAEGATQRIKPTRAGAAKAHARSHVGDAQRPTDVLPPAPGRHFHAGGKEGTEQGGGPGILCAWMDPNATHANLPSNQAMEEQLMSLLNAEVETLQRGELRNSKLLEKRVREKTRVM